MAHHLAPKLPKAGEAPTSGFAARHVARSVLGQIDEGGDREDHEERGHHEPDQVEAPLQEPGQRHDQAEGRGYVADPESEPGHPSLSVQRDDVRQIRVVEDEAAFEAHVGHDEENESQCGRPRSQRREQQDGADA